MGLIDSMVNCYIKRDMRDVSAVNMADMIIEKIGD